LVACATFSNTFGFGWWSGNIRLNVILPFYFIFFPPLTILLGLLGRVLTCHARLFRHVRNKIPTQMGDCQSLIFRAKVNAHTQNQHVANRGERWFGKGDLNWLSVHNSVLNAVPVQYRVCNLRSHSI
jgi:hypothetical protein